MKAILTALGLIVYAGAAMAADHSFTSHIHDLGQYQTAAQLIYKSPADKAFVAEMMKGMDPHTPVKFEAKGKASVITLGKSSLTVQNLGKNMLAVNGKKMMVKQQPLRQLVLAMQKTAGGKQASLRLNPWLRLGGVDEAHAIAPLVVGAVIYGIGALKYSTDCLATQYADDQMAYHKPTNNSAWEYAGCAVVGAAWPIEMLMKGILNSGNGGHVHWGDFKSAKIECPRTSDGTVTVTRNPADPEDSIQVLTADFSDKKPVRMRAYSVDQKNQQPSSEIKRTFFVNADWQVTSAQPADANAMTESDVALLRDVSKACLESKNDVTQFNELMDLENVQVEQHATGSADAGH